MKVTSTGIINGIIVDEYGSKGNHFNNHDMPLYSLPIAISEAPEGTVSYAIVLEDKDAVPVCGFSWIHWLVANLTREELLPGESQTATDFIQGVNSWISVQGGHQSIEASSYYGGMAPPNGPHVYEVHVYALDQMLDLKAGFYMNELYHAMEGHILDCVTLKGIYEG